MSGVDTTVGTYRDAEGYVYRNVPADEAAERGWTLLTPEQEKHVEPIAPVADLTPAEKAKIAEYLGATFPIGDTE